MSFLRLSRRGRALATLLMFMFPGCGEYQPAKQSKPITTADTGPYVPCEVELSEPSVTIPEPGIAQFKVKYRFIRGSPTRFYSCEINFPGTPVRAVKRMEAWQLKTEGTIVDRLSIPGEGVKTYQILFCEAPSGMAPYEPVSNILKGNIAP